MTKKQNKCFQFQTKINNVDSGMCFGSSAGLFKAFLINSRLTYIKAMYYCKTMNCNKCKKIIEANKN